MSALAAPRDGRTDGADVELWLDFVLLGAALSVGAAGILLAEWLRRRRPDPADPPPEDPPPPKRPPEPADSGLPTFRVVALGLEGAGKTVLLASQFHTLSGLDRNRRYFLDSDLPQEQFLEWIFGRVSDTSESWPPGSHIGGTREFLFDCKARDSRREVRNLFRLSYLDYAGELLEPSPGQPEALQEVADRVQGAHALLVLVDGRRALQLLRGDAAGGDYFDRRMRPLLRLAGRSSCPVQLIITKWDVLRAGRPEARDDEERLQEVRDRLEQCAGIEHLLHATGTAQRKVRLIPVSAVGESFAELLPDGTTAKRSGAIVNPINVEVPLCAVLPDLLTHLEDSHIPAEVREELDAELSLRPLADVPTIVHAVLVSPAGRLLRKALSGIVGDEVIKLLVDVLARVRSREKAPPAQVGADEEDVGQLRAAVVEQMEGVVHGLEFSLPSSVLRSRW
ncbi:MAG: hypothetical protein QOJ46_946 [bacterium]|jgi:hypothetical protein